MSDTLGWIYYKQNLPPLAIPAHEESASKDPNNAAYQLHLGLAYVKVGRNEEAIVALRRAPDQKLPPDKEALARQTLTAIKG